jgi:TnpA family transposase
MSNENSETQKAPRRTTKALISSTSVKERFAGFARLIAAVLRNGLAKDSEDYKKVTRETSKVVKGILEAPEKAFEGYSKGLQAAATDIYHVNEKTGKQGRKTEELEAFWALLAENFKGTSTTTPVLPANPKELGLW